MKKDGGPTYKSGISTPENLSKWADYASRNSYGSKYARGGAVHMTAGAISGEGRLQKIRAYGKNARKKS